MCYATRSAGRHVAGCPGRRAVVRGGRRRTDLRPAGLGAEMINAASRRDFQVVQALTLIFGTAIIAINLIADLAVALLDPRTTWR
ncbi:ABC transporter permease subunit [Nonomuraea sp. SYSU D8015]|uniref:ABC transporter permease subunit n=1 Tax=Nonomuraea sp. SYSU D8015 TaxID=2593644 RepID=UPI00300C6F34